MSILASGTEMLRGLVPVLLAAGLAWAASDSSIKPHREREKVDRDATAGLEEKIERAHAAIRETRTPESQDLALAWEIDRLEQEMPGPSTPVLLPEELKQRFARHGLSVSTVRLVKVHEDSDLPGYQRGHWAAEVPIGEAGHKVAEALLAVAEFEQHHLFVRIQEFVIRSDPEDPARRIAFLNVTALFRK